jgi:hypothetical protein
MMDRAGIGGDNPDFTKARQGYLLVDDEKKENRTAYSLPFADVIDGTLTCLITGCRASASRLPQKEGVSDAERSKARAVLDAYFAKANQAEKATDAEERGGYMAFPIGVLRLEERAALPDRVPDEDLLKLARKRAYDPAIFDEAPPLFFPIASSTNKLDSYYTRMRRSSLENFAQDMEAGISFQDSHNVDRLGIGHTLTGRYVGAGGNGVERSIADVFTAPITDDTRAFIAKLRAGMVRDVSGGFYLGPDGKYVCDLCSQDIGRGFHEHWPGMTYEVDGKQKLATWSIEGAHLAEVSAVYDGATPGAVIMKARQASEAGVIAPEMARLLEVQYRIKLPASHRGWAGADLSGQDKPEERAMPENDGGTEWTLPDARREEYRAACSEAGLSPDGFPAVTVRALLTQLKGVESERDTLKQQVETLKPQAEDGVAYRQAMVDETWGEYVRAGLAEKVKEEERKALWSRMPLSQVLEEKAEYTKLGDARNKGGRQTTDPEPERTNGFVMPPAPPSAFRA